MRRPPRSRSSPRIRRLGRSSEAAPGSGDSTSLTNGLARLSNSGATCCIEARLNPQNREVT
jgi:hypothetical protein